MHVSPPGISLFRSFSPLLIAALQREKNTQVSFDQAALKLQSYPTVYVTAFNVRTNTSSGIFFQHSEHYGLKMTLKEVSILLQQFPLM